MCCRHHFSAIQAAACAGLESRHPPLHNLTLCVKPSPIDCISRSKATTRSEGRNPREDLSVAIAIRNKAAPDRSDHHGPTPSVEHITGECHLAKKIPIQPYSRKAAMTGSEARKPNLSTRQEPRHHSEPGHKTTAKIH